MASFLDTNGAFTNAALVSREFYSKSINGQKASFKNRVIMSILGEVLIDGKSDGGCPQEEVLPPLLVPKCYLFKN